MLTVPVSEAVLADLERLIGEQAPEGQRLEFKAAVPESDEDRKRRIRDGTGPEGKGAGRLVPPFGRDRILEELVAFANADGGVVVLGMQETAQAPPRAASLEPLADAASIERVLRDAIVDCIEPRLPYAAVKAVRTDEDGNGVILLETSASVLAPHRVATSRNVTVRRGDRCDRMTMPEIQEMVLRNARRFDEVGRKLAEAEESFGGYALGVLDAGLPQGFVAEDSESRVGLWLRQTGRSALALRVSLVPHFPLGMSRLERLDGMVPDPASFGFVEDGRFTRLKTNDMFMPAGNGGRRVLGGVDEEYVVDDWILRHAIRREGLVEIRLVAHGSRQSFHAPVEWLVSAAFAAFGVYDRLRHAGGQRSVPAEISVGLETWGDVRPANVGASPFATGAKPLPRRSLFPRHTVAEPPDFAYAVNELAADLLNAGGLRSGGLPRFAFGDASS